MDVLGRDSVREAYRVATGGPEDRIVGYIPDQVISRTMTLTGGHGHQTAYDWIARNHDKIESTLRALRDGTHVKAPFDRMVLEED